MAPRNRRTKVGLRRMDAALDAMRPMGFSRDVVIKCVKDLLKVYGNDGWAFIEDAAYKVLIDTILEELEGDQLEHEPEHPLMEGSPEQPEHVLELCDKEVICEEQVSALVIHEPDIHGKDIILALEKSQEQDLEVEVTPLLLQDANDRNKEEVQFGIAPAYSPQSAENIPTNRRCKPCYGWISDDEDDDFVQLAPAEH